MCFWLFIDVLNVSMRSCVIFCICEHIYNNSFLDLFEQIETYSGGDNFETNIWIFIYEEYYIKVKRLPEITYPLKYKMIYKIRHATAMKENKIAAAAAPQLAQLVARRAGLAHCWLGQLGRRCCRCCRCSGILFTVVVCLMVYIASYLI